MNIRKQTQLIIRRGQEFLVGTLERILMGLAITVLPLIGTVGLMMLWMKG